MNRKFTYIFILFCSLIVNGYGQTPAATLSTGKELNVLYRNEASGGVFLHSRGFGMNYRRGKHITGEKKRMLEVEMATMRDPKEVKISHIENSKGYYYGKLNSLILFRPGIGFQNVIFRRGERKSVEIRYSVFGGASLCVAKPVYLEILTETQTINTERYDPEIHNQDNIYGRSPFFTGIDKSKIYPGGYLKFSTSCEYADNSNEIKALELGTILDVYPIPVPIMSVKKNQPFFITLYASFIFGKKWF
jgi:hypothetical protein